LHVLLRDLSANFGVTCHHIYSNEIEMNIVRAFINYHRNVALILLAVVMSVKAIVPAGYMIGHSSKILTVQICTDVTGEMATKQIAIPMKDTPIKSDASDDLVGGQCAYSALSMASLSPADPALLLLALLFIIAFGFTAIYPAPVFRTARLRPPLRGPPAAA
jgi:hypothetical protein